MKYGILSFNINTDDLNYGALLHSFAFQKFMSARKGSYSFEIIDYVPVQLNDFDYRHPLKSYLKQRSWKNVIKLSLNHSRYLNRQRKFETFIRNNMKVSERKYRQADLDTALLPYDGLIVESDVVWSPSMFGGSFDRTFFLDLKSMRGKKKFAYSVSAANMQFSPENEARLKELIKNFDAVSVRESYLAGYLRNTVGIEAEHVLDPVLLLEKEDYEPMLSAPLCKEPYLFLYVPMQFDPGLISAAHEYAEKRGLKVIESSMFVWNGVRHKVFSDLGVEEFLSLIKNADCIFTSSFHAVCFSLLFQKDFYAFERKTGKKTEDLCHCFGLDERYIKTGFSEKESIDFSEVTKFLNRRRAESVRWIDSHII